MVTMTIGELLKDEVRELGRPCSGPNSLFSDNAALPVDVLLEAPHLAGTKGAQEQLRWHLWMNTFRPSTLPGWSRAATRKVLSTSVHLSLFPSLQVAK